MNVDYETLVVYHRCGGKSLGYPPNNLLTARWAQERGARAIEYDVAVARDGDSFQVVVMEPRLLAQAGLDIDHLEWSDVQQLDAGNERYGKQPVPTLEQMLQAVDSSTTAHQIQIKGRHPATVTELLKRLEGKCNYLITAFDSSLIRQIKEHNPLSPTGWLVKPDQETGDEAGVDLTAQLVDSSRALSEYSQTELHEIIIQARENLSDAILLCGPRIKSKSTIDAIRQAGFSVGAWGVAHDLNLARSLILLGVDRFTLDNPEQL